MVVRQARKQPADRLVVPGSPRRVDLMSKGVGFRSEGYVANGWRRIYARIDGKFVAVGWGRKEEMKAENPNHTLFRIQNKPEVSKE